LSGLNVRLAGLTLTSLGFPLYTSTVTSAVGRELGRIWKEPCPPPSVVVTNAYFCAPLSGQPCTFTAFGYVKGCLGKNYTIVLTYLNSSNQFVGNCFTAVSNGNTNWSCSFTTSAPCNGAPYQVLASVVDNPGLIYPNEPGQSENREGNPVTQFLLPQDSVSGPCKERANDPKKAASFSANFVQAFVSCGNPGGNPPNAFTEGGIPSCQPPETYDEQAGSLHWEIEIAPKATSRIDYTFTVECPVGRDVHWE